MLPTVSHQDLGNPTEPGEYASGEVTYQVSRQHVQIWAEQPDAVFSTILCNSVHERGLRFALGQPLPRN